MAQAFKIKTITKTTMNLAVGDVVIEGNIFRGFEGFTIWSVNRLESNPRMAIVGMQFGKNGKIVTTPFGINTKWDVMDKGAN
jgi:hypothetical protein